MLEEDDELELLEEEELELDEEEGALLEELGWELEEDDELLEEELLDEDELELLLDLGSNSKEFPPLPSCSTSCLLPPPGRG